jgi:hypothetical protein
MRKRLAIAALLAPVLATASSPAFADGPPAYVKTVRCSIANHAAVFYARMRQRDDGERMAMRFTLLERTGDRSFTRVRAPGLGRWRQSRSGVSAFGYRQGVRNLVENAVYRMRVDYRWFSSDGEVVEELHRRSSACRQYEALPNLRAEVVGARSGATRGVARYFVRVSNDGRASATAVPVALTVDGDVVDTVTLPMLEPGGSTVLAIRGPECRHEVEAEADPEETIPESSEDDNAHEVRCEDLAR